MVEEAVSEEDKLKARLKELERRISEFRSADLSGSELLQKQLKSMESEADFIRHQFNGYTKEEIFGTLDEIARDFNQLEKLFEFPAEKLYMVKQGYSEKKDDDSIGLYYDVRSNEKLPKASEAVFSFGFVDSTSQTYFILCDPYRKIIVVEQLLYLGEGSWSDVATSLKMALDEKKGADQRGEEYNFIVANLGHVSVKRVQ